MPKNKKKFDKKNAITYSVVSRELHAIGEDGDGAGGEEQGRLRVSGDDLLIHKEEEHKYGIYFADDYNYMRHLREVGSFQGQMQEQTRVGTTASQLLWDSLSVAQASDVGREDAKRARSVISEMSVDRRSAYGKGLTGRQKKKQLVEEEAEPDVEVVAALDSDRFDFDDPMNQLNDDFVLLAEGKLAPEHVRHDSDSDDDDEDFPGVEEDDEPIKGSDAVGGGKWSDSLKKTDMVGAWIEHHDPEVDKKDSHRTAAMIGQWVRGQSGLAAEPEEEDEIKEETRSRFSKYSMTSSVVRRSQGLKDLDEHFEQMFAQYDEDALGGLDLDEHEGPTSNRILQSLLQAARKAKGESPSESEEEEEDESGDAEPDEVAMKFQYEDEDNDQLEGVVMEEELGEFDKLDCQSVISHTTNRSYLPRVISAPHKVRLNRKTGIPLPDDRHPDSSSDNDSESGDDVLSMISSLSVARPKDETPEQRRLRKKALKELRRERRQEKKTSRMAFSVEKIRQEKQGIPLRTLTMV